MRRFADVIGRIGMRHRNGMTLTAAVSVAALLLGLSAAPAYALRDVPVEQGDAASSADSVNVTLANQETAAADAMPDNPNVDLPESMSESIPDDAVFVSSDLVALPSGEVQDASTGETVTDPTLVGTQDAPADPLAKTNGESFVPVSADDVKSSMIDVYGEDAVTSNGDIANDAVEHGIASSGVAVEPASFTGNEYGAYWAPITGRKPSSKATVRYSPSRRRV